MSMPRANEATTCIATALKTEAAMSARLMLRLIRFWMSVFEKTPHREAIGWMFSACAAKAFSSLVST